MAIWLFNSVYQKMLQYASVEKNIHYMQHGTPSTGTVLVLTMCVCVMARVIHPIKSKPSYLCICCGAGILVVQSQSIRVHNVCTTNTHTHSHRKHDETYEIRVFPSQNRKTFDTLLPWCSLSSIARYNHIDGTHTFTFGQVAWRVERILYKVQGKEHKRQFR